MKNFLRVQTPVRLISLGFACVILLGSVLLILPCSVKDGVQLSYIDSLYTSASAVCVTGLVTVDPRDTFTVFGQTVIGLLIQIGGLGVASIGVGIMLAMGKKVDMKGRNIVQESMNFNSKSGVVVFLKKIFITTLFFEIIGAILSFFVFIRDFPFMQAVGVSIFHSIASFNNAGFDILGNMQNLIPYQHSIFLSVVTAILVFFGGIGFLVIQEICRKKLNWKKYSMHSKVVLSTSVFLIVFGAILIKCTEKIDWIGALFHSISARTAGFSTYPIGSFSTAGLMVLMMLMFIGASSGSTGGGVKTTTFFVLFQGIKSAATNKTEKAFRYSIPRDAFRKAAVIVLLGFGIVVVGTYVLILLEPHLSLQNAWFEIISAFGTVGLSTGITPTLGTPAKILTIFIMYIGRLGPLTIASLWYFSRGERIGYPEGNISIG